MDKIVYTCSAEHIGYTFPRRKWWDFSKKQREMNFELAAGLADEDIVVYVRILEKYSMEYGSRTAEEFLQKQNTGIFEEYQSGYDVRIPKAYREEIWCAFAKEILKRKSFEILFVIDPSGEEFGDILLDFTEDKNYLAVFTANPEKYEAVMEQLSMETGLIGMVFTDHKEFVRYQRHICEGKQALIFMGNHINKLDQERKPHFYRFPKESLVLDFSENGVYYKMLRSKRMTTDYVSMPVFLDNIVKNRYNSVVNERLPRVMEQSPYEQQNVYRADDKNKLSEKRKGIKNGRKEKYPNLRRFKKI